MRGTSTIEVLTGSITVGRTSRMISNCRFILPVTCVICLLQTGKPGFAQTTLTPPKDPVSAGYFGMHNHEPLDSKRSISIEVGTYRLWDADVNWPNLEPARDRWQWDRLDRIVDLAQQRRWQLIMPLAFSPRWASARPNENTFDTNSRLGWAAEPANIEDWRVYVRTVATRYKGRVQLYEVWNEPNSSMFFTGSISQLVTLVREAYTILKSIDPGVIMISPSIVHGGGTGLQYLGNYLAQGGGAVADVIGYHFYIEAEPPEQLPVHIADVQRVMSRYGVSNKPLWNTEASWAASEVKFPSMELQAAYVARSYILNWAAGVTQFDWYAWDNRVFPSIYMLEANLQTPTLAATAYVQIRQWLLGSRMLSVASDAANNWTCAIARADGSTGYILWNPDHNSNFTLPSNWHGIRLRNLAGAVQSISSTQVVSIGASPVLIETSAAAYPLAPATAVSAAALSEGPVAPSSLASVFAAGLNAGPEAPGYLPWFETLGGATVHVQDSAGQTSLAQLSYAGPDQINFLVPSSAASGPARVTAIGRDGRTYQASFTVSPIAPGIFTADSTGVGVLAAYAVAVDSAGNQTQTYTFTCANAGQCLPNSVPASTNSRASALVVFGTGIRGATLNAVSVTLCGSTFRPSYIGPHAIFPGLDQVNVPLPSTFRGCGATTIQLRANGVASNAAALAIQ